MAEVLAHPQGKQALKLYRRFWGLKTPQQVLHLEVPGPRDETVVLVGMGTTPEVHLSRGPKGSAGKRSVVRGKHYPAVEASGRRIWMLTGKGSRESKQKLTPVGFAPETHYIPTGRMEKAGTFKANAHWVHKHEEEGGKWPKVYRDQAGNFVYGPSTYRVGKWIRK